MLRFHNIRGGPNSVNLRCLVLLGAYTLLKLWLVADVELGKDEAVYWYWGQNLDASYAFLPLAVFKLTHALYPHQEWFLRLPSALLGAFSTALVYWLCRMQGLAERLALWAAAAFRVQPLDLAHQLLPASRWLLSPLLAAWPCAWRGRPQQPTRCGPIYAWA